MSELALLRDFINVSHFPCLMAKAVFRKGIVDSYISTDGDEQECLEHLYRFIDRFRSQKSKLASFILIFPNYKNSTFEVFEQRFWYLLKKLRETDRNIYKHDPRVSDDSQSDKYSYSLKEEALFILALHPKSPRVARRFYYPAIVFNPHEQFEQLRSANTFNRIRDRIRKRDERLQGERNPMLSDYGEKSEIFQYTGRTYSEDEHIDF
ncbi:MAG: YqcI/YcgG family protein [Bacteriovoracaceae bacterium]|nr:YqcI/YcgG family protein [Bacteriovoracaceae bacterium]